MHELTSPAEMKRLFGAIIDEAIKVDVPGMEIGTQHKYAFNILVDFKPENVSMTPQAVERFRRTIAQRDPSNVCTDVPGFPLAGLLSEPIKIIQAPRTTLVLYEVRTFIARSSPTAARFRRSSIFRLSSATQLDAGKAMSSSSRPEASTTEPHSMR